VLCFTEISTTNDWKKLVKYRWPCHRESVTRISVFGDEYGNSDFSDPRRYYFSLLIRDFFEQHDQCMLH